MLSPAEEWYQAAVIFDHFHVTPAEYGDLTDKQTRKAYAHARDTQTGALVSPNVKPKSQPKKAETLEEALLEIRTFAIVVGPRGFPPEELAKAEKQIQERYGGRRA